MQQDSGIQELYKRWYTGIATEAEVATFRQLLSDEPDAGNLLPAMQTFWEEKENNHRLTEARQEQIATNILQRYPAPESTPIQQRRIPVMVKALTAAAILIVIITTTWLFITTQQQTRSVSNHTSPDLPPATNRAILTIGNGEPIQLSETQTGIIVNEDVRYTNGSKIADAGQVVQLRTPNGGQYQVVLPDGSKVWLNAASSIRFPTQFNGRERRISVAGEVYIEVANSKTQAFYVTTPQSEIQVLGTAFNINAYSNEPAEQTTLASGKIKILPADLANGSPALLLPGQQAVTAPRQAPVLNTSVNLEQVMAWRNGVFNFEGADIQKVMREVARWYDVEVVFEGTIGHDEFGGAMDRSITLQRLLKAFSEWQIRYRLEGRKLTIIGK